MTSPTKLSRSKSPNTSRPTGNDLLDDHHTGSSITTGDEHPDPNNNATSKTNTVRNEIDPLTDLVTTTTTTTTSKTITGQTQMEIVMTKKEYIWEWNMDKIRSFIQKSDLFPTKCSTSSSDNDSEYQNQLQISNNLLNNFCQALQSASKEHNQHYHDHVAKKQKVDNIDNKVPLETSIMCDSTSTNQNRDWYNILDSTFSKGSDVIHEPGTIISRLTLNGFINALAGQIGGIVDVNSNMNIHHHNQNNNTETISRIIPTASNLTIQKIIHKASTLYYNIQAQLEIDMLESTPIRIINLLCPELSLSQISSIRHRVVETVIHGRGTNTSNFLYSLEDDNGGDNIPTMAKHTSMLHNTHEINKFKKCKVCNNNDQGGNGFVLDKKNGDVICMRCGTVVSESLMHEGSMYRKFEGEEDRNHHGDVSNPLYSNAYNMATSLSGGIGIGAGGFRGGAGGKGGNIETILKRVHNYTEMNISQMGKEEKKTRIGYKDRQKKDAFVQMNHVGDALSLHQAVLQRAKELFAGFRDDRELLQQFKGVIAACLCEAFDQLSSEGKHILKIQATGGEREDVYGGDGGTSTSSNNQGAQQQQQQQQLQLFNRKFNARANRRNELHSSNLAGQGGLKLNLPQHQYNKQQIQKDEKKEDGGNHGKQTVSSPKTPKTPTPSDLENKPLVTWNLDDVRSWLLETSRNIAKKWFEQQNDTEKGGNNSDVNIQQIPRGRADEMEGRLVQHSLKICSMLEGEIKKKSLSSSKSSSAVITPRVNEMGKLGIKWQHKHERGSGGAGGVGYSGRSMKGAAIGTSSNRTGKSMGGGASGGGAVAACGNKTVGQILRLKTGSQLKKVIGDDVAGEAFYKELRGLVGRQDAKAKKELSEEASIRRMNQMKRKPELQARVQL